MVKTIGNPISWGIESVSSVGILEGAGAKATNLQIRDLTFDDIRDALRNGLADAAAFRSDIIFVVILYPLIGASLAWFIFHLNMLPLLFPLIAGFALIGPVAAVGLYELSRRREAGEHATWLDGFAVFKSRTMGPILLMGIVLLTIFTAWMLTAYLIFLVTLGPDAPASTIDFVREVLTTGAGWTMAILGVVVGFGFAAVVLSISLVSVPLLLDRKVGVPVAIVTSLRVAERNPKIAAVWGLIVAAALVLGALPVLLGLILVIPVLGHATWHLYRSAVVHEGEGG